MQKLVGDLEFKRVLTTSTHKTLELVQKALILIKLLTFAL